MREDLRELLEAVAFGEDARITPDHRLRAVEMLRDVSDPEPYDFARELIDVSDEEVQIQTDCYTASLLLLASDDERRAEWPETMRAVERVVEDRIAERERGRKNGRRKSPGDMSRASA
jgi:hypothetical protein